ncbi:hypothetical protein ACFOLF_05020 [Paenibacillus sepulcri]
MNSTDLRKITVISFVNDEAKYEECLISPWLLVTTIPVHGE